MHDIAADSKPFWRNWVLTLGLTGCLLILATLPPFVDLGWRTVVMHAFSHSCHQIAERSPVIMETPLAVCHRCYGIYSSLSIGTVLFLGLGRWDNFLSRHTTAIFLVALSLLFLDWLLGVTGMWQNTPVSRTATGGFLGSVAGVYLTRALTQLQKKS